MSTINNKSSDEGPLLFEIISAHINEGNENEKRHVVYSLQVQHVSGDIVPTTIERRYTDFYNLYTALKVEKPELMTSISFPRKVLLGNFDNSLIMSRSTGFESLLKHISIESKLRTSSALLRFLQEPELEKTKKLLKDKQYFHAVTYLENNFRLLNKVYTDRSPPVLLALCRLLACCVPLPDSSALKWADLALHRYEGVSDSDLLELYVPLLQVCSKLWQQFERDKSNIDERIADLKKRGFKVEDGLSLMEEVERIEEKLYPKSS